MTYSEIIVDGETRKIYFLGYAQALAAALEKAGTPFIWYYEGKKQK